MKNEKVVWNDIQIIKVDKANTNSFYYKTDFDAAEYEEVNVRAKQRGRFSNIGECNLNKSYVTPPSISEKTKGHLMELCKKNLIKKVHHKFYQDLVDQN